MKNPLLISMDVTYRCNFKCSYCYLNKKRTDITLNTAYKIVDFIGLISKLYSSITIVFYGGEPTLVFDKIKKIIKYSKDKYNINSFLLVTNGFLLKEKMIEFLALNNVSLVVSMDGVQPSQDINRRLINGSCTWKKLDGVLDIINSRVDLFDKKKPNVQKNPFRIRVTLTPKTVTYLSETVSYLISKFRKKRIMITVMPCMSIKGAWNIKQGYSYLTKILDNEFINIAKLYIKYYRLNEPFDFSLNECFPFAAWSGLFNPLGLTDIPSCSPGIRELAIDIKGNIYPCHLLTTHSNFNKKYCMGNINEGITNLIALDHFKAEFGNRYFSCLYWNKLIKNNIDSPVCIYKSIYESWLRAVKYIKNNLETSKSY